MEDLNGLDLVMCQVLRQCNYRVLIVGHDTDVAKIA